MSKPTDYIAHPGIIQSVHNDNIRVMILAESACASCKVKGMCSVAEMKEKIIEVNRPESNTYKVGQQVRVVMQKSLGLKAVFLGYILPFLITVFSLFGFISLDMEQGVAALTSLLLLVPYYLILYRFRDKLKSRFMFRLE